jgi:hypothetical protein
MDVCTWQIYLKSNGKTGRFFSTTNSSITTVYNTKFDIIGGKKQVPTTFVLPFCFCCHPTFFNVALTN